MPPTSPGCQPNRSAPAAEAAVARGLSGKWLIPLQNTTTQPLLAQLSNRALRERLFKASPPPAPAVAWRTIRRSSASSWHCAPERAALLGYRNHATYQLEDESAGNPAAVRRILADLVPIALARTREDAVHLQHN